jgi:hypothetical protein
MLKQKILLVRARSTAIFSRYEVHEKFCDYGVDAWDGDSKIEQDMEGSLSE